MTAIPTRGGGSRGEGGGELPNSPTPSMEDSDGKPMSMIGQCLSLEFTLFGESSAARKTHFRSLSRQILCCVSGADLFMLIIGWLTCFACMKLNFAG